ncbi:murein transglycosylase A [Nitrosomonas mobilis]|uniref:peptidoglycan lytic exotransglycosylase n=1 Tax=Nitrosomonas mobilis TaxID=51642 RepID=A0A1G5SGV1_9PROT|nr:MltA domain-containing protein [Nitrosomonas mobilis]SCZ86348.1 MltA domain protein [Nitrosomonas mobilis]HNO74301.1 MltA domain-containing protein [Nitrosomonas mobilis]
MKTQSILLLAIMIIGLISCKSDAPTRKETSGKKQTETQQTKIIPDKSASSRESSFIISISPDKEPSASVWTNLPEWQHHSLLPAWYTFLKSCKPLQQKPDWRTICDHASRLISPDEDTIRRFLETYFTPQQVTNKDGHDIGLITGYYEPLLKGSRRPSKRFRYPIYAQPSNLLKIDLGIPPSEGKFPTDRGRLEGRKVIPYYTRAEIENNQHLLRNHAFLWVEDKVELFFLQIQGSGRIILDNGEMVKIGFADHNGYPYRSIGKLLIEQGELNPQQASMQHIKQWGEKNPHKLDNLLQQNARFIFFRELPANISGPIGAMGIPLTARRSIAIDPENIPLGALVYLSTTWPNTGKPLNRLMVAQDTGNAIKGEVRADFFWGHGEEAALQAGKMKQPVRMWVLLPKKDQMELPQP